MLRVLLVAPTIDRDDVGESWVAFQWAKQLSERHDLTVLTYRKQGHPPIAPQLPLASVVEWRETPLVGRAERVNSLMKPAYFRFAWQAHHWLKRALRNGARFDVAHQPLPVAMRYPTPLLNLGIPYVLGPVGGSLDSPPAFDEQDTAPWYVKFRKLDSFRLRHDPLLRASFGRARIVLGIAPYVSDALRSIPVSRLEYVSETGLEYLPPDRPRQSRPGPVRLLFVGRVIRTEGVRDLITAMAQIRDVDVATDIVGDGFDLEACKRLAHDVGVSERLTFHGRVPRAEVDHHYRSADIFVFPSFREPGGNAVFEAMSFGLPLIVCDRGGPSAAADESCAIRLPAESPTQLAKDLAEAIRRLARDEQLRLTMGAAARLRVQSVGLWSSKIDLVSSLYAQIAREAS